MLLAIAPRCYFTSGVHTAMVVARHIAESWLHVCGLFGAIGVVALVVSSVL